MSEGRLALSAEMVKFQRGLTVLHNDGSWNNWSLEKMHLLDFAVTHEAELLPPIGMERITAFEVEKGFILPDGLREFYLRAGGTNEFTDSVWRIWPFEELTTLDHKVTGTPDLQCLQGFSSCPDLADYVAFIDTLIEAPVYAVCANPRNPRWGEVIGLSGDSEPFLVGPIKTFEEFLLILVRHWNDGPLPDTIDGRCGGGGSAALLASPQTLGKKLF
jgi:hypothetical protein